MNLFHRIQLALLSGCASLLSLLGFRGLSRIGSGVGRLMWHLLPSRRRLATQNVARHLNLPEEQARDIARSAFRHNARSFMEILLTDRFGMDFPELRIGEPELFQQLKNCSRPIVAATAHLGAWELLASMLGELYEPPRPRMVVVRRYPNPAVQAFISSRREARGATMVGHRTVVAAVLRALRKNGIVAFLVDHNAPRSEALFLPFMGEETARKHGAGPACRKGGSPDLAGMPDAGRKRVCLPPAGTSGYGHAQGLQRRKSIGGRNVLYKGCGKSRAARAGAMVLDAQPLETAPVRLIPASSPTGLTEPLRKTACPPPGPETRLSFLPPPVGRLFFSSVAPPLEWGRRIFRSGLICFSGKRRHAQRGGNS